MSTRTLLFWVLRVSVAGVFLGRAYQHLRWDVPYGAFFRSEALLGPVVRWLGGDWTRFANAVGTERFLAVLSVFMGVFFLVCGGVAICHSPAAGPFRRARVVTLILGGWALMGLAALAWMDSGLKSAMFIEHGAQFMGPIVLVYAARAGAVDRLAGYLGRVAVAFTFAGHGAFAVGWYGMPGHWVTMTMTALGVEQDSAIRLLFLAGVFDMVVALWVLVGIFRPGIDRVALMYAAVWGTVTALARIWTGVEGVDVLVGMDLWLHETVFRLIHGGLPLALYLAQDDDAKGSEGV